MRISDWSSDVCSSDLVGGGKSALDTVHRVGHLAEEDDIGPQRGGTARRARPSLAHRPVPVLPRPARGAQCRQQFAVHVEQPPRSEEHTSELQSLMRISYAVFCLKKKTKKYEHREQRINRTQ